MFQKIKSTNYPPSFPILIWDGECKFCKWWKTRWELKTKNQLNFKTYQEVASEFPDIPLKEFKKASRLIATDGKVYSGPDSAYRSLYMAGNKKWHQWYSKYNWFQKISDFVYNHIAKNRNFYYKATSILFSKDPEKPKKYWLYYLLFFNNSINSFMKFFKTYWLYIVAALITIFGILTGWYLFIFFAIPFALFKNKDTDE